MCSQGNVRKCSVFFPALCHLLLVRQLLSVFAICKWWSASVCEPAKTNVNADGVGHFVGVLQVLQRLQQKRAALEKELAKFPGAPTSSKDVFHLCRGFERAFSYTVEVQRQTYCTVVLGC